MTYLDKYNELSRNLERATKNFKLPDIALALRKDDYGVPLNKQYYDSRHNYQMAYKAFDQLLAYMMFGSVQPDDEFHEKEYMYQSIKTSQKRLERNFSGTDKDLWESSQSYECTIAISDQPFSLELTKYNSYHFPLSDMAHGRECAAYLAGSFNNDPAWNMVIKLLNHQFIGNCRPLYLEVVLSGS